MDNFNTNLIQNVDKNLTVTFPSGVDASSASPTCKLARYTGGVQGNETKPCSYASPTLTVQLGTSTYSTDSFTPHQLFIENVVNFAQGGTYGPFTMTSTNLGSVPSTTVEYSPDTFTSCTMTPPSTKAAAIGTFEFTIQIKNTIPQNGLFVVKIPTQIEPQGIPNSGSMTIGGTPVTGLTHEWSSIGRTWTIRGGFTSGAQAPG